MIQLSAPVAAVLRDLAAFGTAHDAAEPRRELRMLNLDWAAAETLHLLVRLAGRRRILEIGTSNGFSAIWLAAALPDDAGARLITIDRDREKLKQARFNLGRAGLGGRVDLLEGEATRVVEGLTGPFDCVFFDADRVSAPDQLTRLLPKLSADALVFADNVLSHAGEVAGYLGCLEGLGEFDGVLLPVGKGLHMAARRQV